MNVLDSKSIQTFEQFCNYRVTIRRDLQRAKSSPVTVMHMTVICINIEKMFNEISKIDLKLRTMPTKATKGHLITEKEEIRAKIADAIDTINEAFLVSILTGDYK